MATVLLLSSVPEGDPYFPYFARHDLDRLRSFAGRDRFGVHSLTEDAASADLIVFVERAAAAGRFLESVRRHPLVARYREKVFVCNSRYFGIPFLPGIYGSIHRRDCVFPHRVRSGHYLEVNEREALQPDPDAERTYLYSFLGAVKTWPAVRAPLAQLNHPRGFFLDTSSERKLVEEDRTEARRVEYLRRYVDVMRKSRFVLCPRGDAVSSMRLFESLKMGRPPVIIADGWIKPAGPDWGAFSVSVREKDIASIPRLLEKREEEAEEMGRRARLAWDDWFADEVVFHRVVEACLDILAHRRVPESIVRLPAALGGLARPQQLRRYVGSRLAHLRAQPRVAL
jgi:hypothetical protein